MQADVEKFNELYLEKYGSDNVPKFLMGHSLGGCFSSFIAAESKQIYDGICFVAPYFDVYDRRLLDKLEPAVKMIYKVTPNR